MSTVLEKRRMSLKEYLAWEETSGGKHEYDRGRKFEFYQLLESLAEYVVVYQTEAKAIHYVRQGDGTWNYRLLVGMESTLRLESLGCDLPFEAIYRNVEFGPETEPPAITPAPGDRSAAAVQGN